jgi:DNA-nicking Smr family endonuclease
MSRRTTRKLSDEDRVLWSLVARSAVPLKGREAVDIPEPPKPKAAAPTAPPATARSAVPGTLPSKPAAPPRPAPKHIIDRPTLDKLAKGRVPIEGRVDLHGMSQDEAYFLLITGKGSSSGGDGVLRRAVPGWLATPPFRVLVSSHDLAAQRHGGAGALYVRLRRHAQK